MERFLSPLFHHSFMTDCVVMCAILAPWFSQLGGSVRPYGTYSTYLGKVHVPGRVR